MKKKVRYAAGALGALGMMPAVGLAALPATAATHTPAATGKTVAAQLPNAPAVLPCLDHYVPGSGPNLTGNIYVSHLHGCVGEVGAYVSGNHTAYDMRVRYYHKGTQIYPTSYYQNGIYSPPHGLTVWSAYPKSPLKTGVTQVCQAITTTGPGFTVKDGPICENTGYTG